MFTDPEREKLVEAVGIHAANRIETLEDDIKAITEYLEVIKVYGTQGWKYVHNSEKSR
jgi:hypothetical protein